MKPETCHRLQAAQSTLWRPLLPRDVGTTKVGAKRGRHFPTPMVSGAQALSALLGAIALPGTAAAHGADANQIQLVVHEVVGELVATPPVDSPGLAFADEDSDGHLTRDELSRHRPAVLEALLGAVMLHDEAGRPARVERADVSLPATPTTPGIPGRDFVRLTLRLVFDAPPTAVRVICRFAGDHPVHMTAHRADGRADPGRLNLNGGPQFARFDRAQTEAVVFGDAAPARRGEWSWAARAAPWLLPLGLLGTLIARVRGERRRRRAVCPPGPTDP